MWGVSMLIRDVNESPELVAMLQAVLESVCELSYFYSPFLMC